MYHLAISLLSYLSTLEEAPLGPQTPEAIAKARSALNGRFYGGDMIFQAGIPPNVSHAGVKSEQLRWPGYPGSGVIPYVIDPSVRKHKAVIEKAMDQYRKRTCIKFVPRTTEKNYIKIEDDEFLCGSMVGMANIGEQPVYLSEGCEYIGTIVHELGHVIGLYHEHQRSDRDRYININVNNIAAGNYRQFDIINSADEMKFTSYDYKSIMHYGSDAFSKDPDKYKTMEAKNGQVLLGAYHKPGLTVKDALTVRKLYKC